MSMGRALALLGTTAEGYVQGNREAEAAQRARNAEDFAQQERAFRVGQMQRTVAQQQAVANAGAPVTAEPDMVPGSDGPVQNAAPDPSTDSIDVGQPGTAPPQPLMRVGNQTGLTPPQAMQAAATQNAPQAVAARTAAAVAPFDPVAAQQMRTANAGEQSQLIDLAAKTWNTDVQTALAKKDPGAFAKLMSESGGDGQGGKFKVKAVVSPDGKTFGFVQVMPDGSEQPSQVPPGSLPNNDDGYLRLAAGMSKVPPQQQLDHLLMQRREAERERHEISMENAAAERNRVLDNYYTGRNEASMTRALNTGAGRRADHFDEKEWDAANKIDPASVSFPDPNGLGKGVESPELRNVYLSRVSELRRSGDMAPNEASEDARTKVLQVRDLALQRVAETKKTDPKSTLTEPQAVKQIMAEAAVRAAAAARAATQPPVAQDPAIRAAPPGGVTRTPAGFVQTPPRAAPAVAPAPGAGMQQAVVPGVPSTSAGGGRGFAIPEEPGLEAQARAENIEMGNGKRTAYSPPVQAYMERKSIAKQREAQAYREAELARAQARSRTGSL